MNASNSKNKLPRFRPRFSIRTLVVIMTLVCCYAACLKPTKQQGVLDLKMATVQYPAWQVPNSVVTRGGHYYVAPLVVANDFHCFQLKPRRKQVAIERHYYFWFFGYVVKLPYEREIELRGLEWYKANGKINGRTFRDPQS